MVIAKSMTEHEQQLDLTVELARERTRLANRRTFLAWARTALAVMTFGFLLEKVDAFLGTAHVSALDLRDLQGLGLAGFIVGPLMLLTAGYRHIRLELSLGGNGWSFLLVPELVLFVAVVGAALFISFS